jgi:hypothetical protein
MRATIVLALVLAAPFAFAGDELPAEMKKALDAVVEGGDGAAQAEKTLLASKEPALVAKALAHTGDEGALGVLAKLIAAHKDLDANARKEIFALLVHYGGDSVQPALEALTGAKGPKTRLQWNELYTKEFKEEVDAAAFAAAKQAAEKLLAALQPMGGKPLDSPELRAAIREMRIFVAKDAEATADDLLARLREKIGVKVVKPDVAAAKKLLVVTCIVVDPRPESRNRAIVHWDGNARIYSEGDSIRDTDDDVVVGQLRIKKIAEGVITFTLGGGDFTVELKSPN